jgi:coiled-coil domain-containing protein 55
MTHFYRKLLEESEQKHEETVAATRKPVIGPMPNLTITKPPDFAPKSDLELARIAREQGREVELNDDNLIVDKRELLAPGLNLAAPNTRKLGLRTKSTAVPANSVQEVQAHRAVGTAASRREINERRAMEVFQQIEDENKRIVEEKIQAEKEAMRRIVARRNTEDDVQSARERYLQRKRRKLEEEADVSQQSASLPA